MATHNYGNLLINQKIPILMMDRDFKTHSLQPSQLVISLPVDHPVLRGPLDQIAESAGKVFRFNRL